MKPGFQKCRLSLVSVYHRRRRHFVMHPNSIRASTNQGQGIDLCWYFFFYTTPYFFTTPGCIFLPLRAAALPRLDAGSGGVKPT